MILLFRVITSVNVHINAMMGGESGGEYYRVEENIKAEKSHPTLTSSSRMGQTCDLAIFIHALTKIFNVFRCIQEMEEHEF